MTGGEFGTPRDLAAAYALGALDAVETKAFEALLARDAELAREVAEYREVAALLALGEPRAPQPTDRLRARVIAAAPARQISTAPSSKAGRTWMPWALAASLLGAIWLGAGRARLELKLEQAYTLLSQRDTLLAQRDTLLESQQRTLDALLAPGVELYQLTATGDPVPGVQLFWDRKRNRAIIHSFGVKPLPSDRAYQLWFIQDGKPVPSITFRPGADGRARVEAIEVPAGPGVTAAAVTEEPLGGSPQPTSAVYLLGKLPGA
jgi:anti-sigma-K factor RskA